MARRLLAGTSWKMNKTAQEAGQYAAQLLPLLAAIHPEQVDVFFLPPFTSLARVAPLVEHTPLALGAQNMHWDSWGAWTGEISAPMLTEFGCRYVELGHSERRSFFNETDEFVNRKVLAALNHHLTPIICIGETMAEKSEGRAEAVLEMQVNITLRDVPPERLPDVILAYEPRWAIGQKEAAAPDYIQMAHAFIRRHLVSRYGQDAVSQTRVIYGGSVTVENAGDIISQPDVDGLFVGRAALDPGGFAGIVQIVAVEAGRRSA